MDMNNFKQNVRNLKAVQATRIKIGNGIYGSTIERLLANSPALAKIILMRRDPSVDKKETARTIKKALKDLGLTDEEISSKFKDAKKTDFYYSDLLKMEKRAEKEIVQPDLDKLRIYNGFLKLVTGLGTLTSAQLIAIVGDMERFKQPSSLWSYFGVGDAQKQKLKHGVTATWNPTAKSLLLGVIAENFIRQKGQYKIIYNERKKKTLTTHPEWHNLNPDGTKNTGKNMNPKHADKDARRVMMKRFLCEFWKAGYLAKGIQPPRNPYILNNPKHHLDPDIVAYQPSKEGKT